MKQFWSNLNNERISTLRAAVTSLREVDHGVPEAKVSGKMSRFRLCGDSVGVLFFCFYSDTLFT